MASSPGTQKAGNYESRAIWRQGLYQWWKSEEDIVNFQKQVDAIKSAQKAKIGAAGVTSEGSPTEAILSTQTQANQAIERKRFWEQVNLQEARTSMRLTRKAANMSTWSGMLGGTAKVGGAAVKGYMAGADAGANAGTGFSWGAAAKGFGWSLLFD